MPSAANDATSALGVNRRHWDELGTRHPDTPYFRRIVERIASGGTSLRRIEIDEVGDVRGRSLLHLQCHLGTESVSWARQGARVTAVDFSPAALHGARRIAAELGAEIRFVEADVLTLDRVLNERFDVVYTSWGVLGWLPDLRAWGRVIEHLLVPGGVAYVAEFHPVAWMFDETSETPRLMYPYFGDEPLRDDTDGSYADRTMHVENRTTYNWYFTIGDVVSALAGAGLHVEFLHEWPRSPEPLFAMMVPDSVAGEEWYRLRDDIPAMPLSFTVRARRPA